MSCTLKCTTSEFFCIRQYSNMALAICRRRSSSINQLFLYLPSSKKTGRWELLAVAMVWSEPLGRHVNPLKRSWCSGIPGSFHLQMENLEGHRTSEVSWWCQGCQYKWFQALWEWFLPMSLWHCGIAVFMRRVSMSQGFTAWCCPGPPPASLGGSTVP